MCISSANKVLTNSRGYAMIGASTYPLQKAALRVLQPHSNGFFAACQYSIPRFHCPARLLLLAGISAILVLDNTAHLLLLAGGLSVYAKGGTPIDPYRTTNGIGPTAPPYPGAASSDADPTYPRGTIEQRSMVEDTASQISQEWKRGEDVVGPEPRIAFRLWSGVLSGASATTGRLQMETQPDIWVVRLMPKTSVQVVTIDLGNGDMPLVPCQSAGQRLVLPAYRRWINLTNDSGFVTDVYYVVVGLWGDTAGKFDWL